jgi:purine-binding chemotaxis protein CheW
MASEQLVVFQLKTEEYAIPIAQVKEIIRYNGATKLPNTPDYIDGIINLRDKVITVIDLAGKFLFATDKSTDKQVLIVEAAGQEVGLVVDTVTEVIRLNENEIEAADGLGYANETIRSIGKAGKRLFIILDLNKLFIPEELAIIQDTGLPESIQLSS